jgi:hypothetical protein
LLLYGKALPYTVTIMAKQKQKTGRALERVVACLERALGGKSGVTVESPKLLRDSVTGEMREHDVVVSYPSGHHAILLAIECRDRSRKVTVNEVEGFVQKCRDTGVSKGLMVSPKGFCKTSLTKARCRGITCLTLQQADAFDWLLAPGVRSEIRQIRHIDWKLFPKIELAPMPTSFSVVDSSGQTVPPEAMREGAQHEFQRLPRDQLTAGTGRISIVFETPGVLLRDDSTGAVHAIGRAIADIEYQITEKLIPFKLVKYAMGDGGDPVTHAAMADIEAGTNGGKLMIMYKPNEGARVVFVPNPKGDG